MNLLPKVSRKMVRIATNTNLTIPSVLVLIELRLEQSLSILSWDVCGKPTLVVAVGNSTTIYPSAEQPVANSAYGALRRREEITDFLRRQVFAVSLRMRVGDSQKTLLTELQVALLEANANWNDCVGVNTVAFSPAASHRVVRQPSLVEDMAIVGPSR